MTKLIVTAKSTLHQKHLRFMSTSPDSSLPHFIGNEFFRKQSEGKEVKKKKYEEELITVVKTFFYIIIIFISFYFLLHITTIFTILIMPFIMQSRLSFSFTKMLKPN